MSGVLQETRSETLARHVQQQLHETRTSRESYAVSVVEHYHARVAPAARTVEFRSEGDAFACAKTNAQRLFRMLDASFADTRVPVDLEEAMVFALPSPYREACVRALARRYGLLDVPIPVGASVAGVLSIGGFVAGFGECVSALAPVLSDGRIDAADAPFVREAIEQVDRLLSAANGLEVRLKAVLHRSSSGGEM